MPVSTASSRPPLSVVICTYNPRGEYLSRTLEGLKAQDFPREDWELLIIDNGSAVPVAKGVDLGWHPLARIVVEPKQGIASARIRAMQEFTGELLVFLDDDNVLDADYLRKCSDLFAARPDLGAASGCLMPEYEEAPPAWFGPYESWLAVRRITKSAWSNFLDSRSEPVTAGMCLRRNIAAAYVKETVENPKHRILGSRESIPLLRGEDVALAKNALKLGYTIGQFAELRLLHLIPKRRSDPDYLFALYRHLCASGHLISWVDGDGRQPIRLPWRVVAKSAYRYLKGGWIGRRLVTEEFKGYRLARGLVKDWPNGDQAGATAGGK
jgi:glycosyltransferase involved in cell wall biosynthesis